jgi:hypothetical protein
MFAVIPSERSAEGSFFAAALVPAFVGAPPLKVLQGWVFDATVHEESIISATPPIPVESIGATRPEPWCRPERSEGSASFFFR